MNLRADAKPGTPTFSIKGLRAYTGSTKFPTNLLTVCTSASWLSPSPAPVSNRGEADASADIELEWSSFNFAVAIF